MRFGVLGILLVSVLGAGCGYSMVRYEGSLGDVKTVAIETPANGSSEPGVEFMVADSLRREFLKRRGAKLVPASQADLVISGLVKPIGTGPSAFSSVVLALEYEVTLVLDLQAVRPDGSRIAIDPRAMRESERYLASADVEAQRKNRQEALRRLCSIMAGRVYDSLYESLVE